MRPASMRCRPAMLMSVVVLPQPDGVSRVAKFPLGPAKLMASTARSPANRFTRPCTSRYWLAAFAVSMAPPDFRGSSGQRLAPGQAPKDEDADEQRDRLRHRQRRGQR